MKEKVYLVTGVIVILDTLFDEQRKELFSSSKSDAETIQLSNKVYWLSDLESILEHYPKS